MARLSPNDGPPRSRTLVKPRISMSLAALPAATLTKPMSQVSTASCGHGCEHEVDVRVDQPGHQRAPAALRCASASTPAGGRDRRAGDRLDDVAHDQDVRRRREPVGFAVEDADVLEDDSRGRLRGRRGFCAAALVARTSASATAMDWILDDVAAGLDRRMQVHGLFIEWITSARGAV